MGDVSKLPPGFHFYPTDEELVVHFLQRKASLLPFHPDLIPDLHLYPYINPWELQGKAMEEGNKWYFYSRKTHANRSTETGYWNSMGSEEPVFSHTNNDSSIVGMKKYYVFCLGNHASSVKTNWIMQEFRLSDLNDHHSASSSKRRPSKSKSKSKKDHSKWVLCRVYEHCDMEDDEHNNDNGMELSCMDEVFLSLDDLDEISYPAH